MKIEDIKKGAIKKATKHGKVVDIKEAAKKKEPLQEKWVLTQGMRP